MNELKVIESSKIPGLLQIELAVHADDRGSFTEVYQQEKIKAAGVPDWFTPVQTNFSHNNELGVLRGIHAEPWNKYITPLNGEVFVAVVDLREGNFGVLETFKLKLGHGLFVPKGCGNSYQTLTENVDYLYHVDDHWKAGLSYPSINPFDLELSIDWPVPQTEAILSDKDLANPNLSEVTPLKGL